MRGKIFKYVSNIAFALGAVLAAIALYVSYSARAQGLSPVSRNLGFIIPAIALLAVAFVTSFFAEKSGKRGKNALKDMDRQ